MPRLASQSDMNRVVNGAKRQIDRALRNYFSGRTDAVDLAEKIYSVLEDRHGRAAYLGRARAGDRSPFEEDDRTYGRMAALKDRDFLDNFIADLDGETWARDAEGTLDFERVYWRAHLYADKLVGTANETFDLASEDYEINWRLGPVKEAHCDDCPSLAAGSPYRSGNLPTHPRAGETQCVNACKCHLERSDGRTGFRPTE